MREQMIEWVSDDILPEVKKGKKPEDVLLKFAKEKNLAPALLEGMGHLFNTAKTISHLEKAANRGSTFAIIDVPELLEKYQEVRPAVKSASVRPDAPNADLFNLPDLFAGIISPQQKEATVSPGYVMENPEYRASLAAARAKAEVELLKQARFEAQEDILRHAKTIETKVRENWEATSFHQLEQDALYAFGDSAKPAMDKVAHLLVQNKLPVKRASDGGARRLVKDPFHMLDEVDAISDKMLRIEAIDEIILDTLEKSAGKTFHGKTHWEGCGCDSQCRCDGHDEERTMPGECPMCKAGIKKKAHAHQTAEPDVIDQVVAPGRHGGKGGGKGAPMKPDGQKPDQKKSPPTNKPPAPAEPKTIIGGLNNAIDSRFDKHIVGQLYNGGKGPFEARRNNDQETVDLAHRDARHMSVLQDLLTRDEVLADADPEKVIDIYNTLRENSPEIAGDINVARVILRSAVQHDGISPFDLKGFLDTENARQKVDFNNRAFADQRYGGKPVSGKPM